ncbi:hypothetical protein PM3016_4611 [Paenibacillus mucilaginosus 3016]|uniref:DUF4362 domain-containing protein n=3 Tax=Paenibacillus mucilaginosus TaxID=61624 RepID=H6NDL7_9BACL|nr:DUF4362 domain-containing protein [Paenibacillus mucilaginosus]AFC31357.1 hypothetical protein PM3016_4611 [Paenibacillus mucilaginosus 3016]AFH63692.1 hypothetical protein B2K_23905 [Paenibacillus mucilaginosus K02]WFA19914.1 DUF4362 domain-containing protein [Paenibacillus mucilaginosus]
MNRLVACFAGAAILLWGCESSEMPGKTKNVSAEVTNQHGNVENLTALDQYVQHSLEGQRGAVRIVHMTIEGDPIYNDLSFSGAGHKLRIDTTQDKFGSPKITDLTCRSMEKVESSVSMKYVLRGCSGEADERTVLHIAFDLAKQDRFEFALRYGPSAFDLQNEISTIDSRLSRDLINGSVHVAQGFEIPFEAKQRIYRALVLANYLGTKELSEGCEAAADETSAGSSSEQRNFSLKVLINGGSREFRWANCGNDSSGNTLGLTTVAEEIIREAEQTEAFRSLPPVQGARL